MQLVNKIFGNLILRPATGTNPTVLVPSEPNLRIPPVDAQQNLPRTASVGVDAAATKEPDAGYDSYTPEPTDVSTQTEG